MNYNMRITNSLKLIAFIECLLGSILLINEIVEFIDLPLKQEVNSQFGELVDWLKYKESCYKNLYLYSLLTITGFSFWINRKLYWGLTQVVLICLCFITIINLWLMSPFNLRTSICLGVLFLIIFIYLEIKIR